MKPNMLLLMTTVLLVLLLVYTLVWVGDLIDEESDDEHGHYNLFEFEDFVIGMVFAVSYILFFIGLVAYKRDGRKNLLLMSVGYAILLLNSGIWLLEELQDPLESYLPLNALKAVLIFSALLLVATALYLKRYGK